MPMPVLQRRSLGDDRESPIGEEPFSVGNKCFYEAGASVSRITAIISPESRSRFQKIGSASRSASTLCAFDANACTAKSRQ